MHVYRLCKAKYPPLDDYGAYLYGGRWNSPGRAVIYAAASRALAALEFLTGVERHTALGPLQMVAIEVPNGKINSLKQDEIPKNWRTYPAGYSTKMLGDLWIQKAESLCLTVPSVIIPEEYNVLINPQHADFKNVKIVDSKSFEYDSRLF
jgi:RES domain-containing protein